MRRFETMHASAKPSRQRVIIVHSLPNAITTQKVSHWCRGRRRVSERDREIER